MYRYQTRFAWKLSILENDTIDIVSNIPVSFICLGNGPPFSRQLSGAPNDGFLLNTLKTLLCYPEYRLEALYAALWNLYLFGHPKETWAFPKLHEGLEYYFPETLRRHLTYYESETFSNSSLYHIFESENFRFPFFYEIYPDFGSKMWNLNFRKSKGFNEISFENCTWMERSPRNV